MKGVYTMKDVKLAPINTIPEDYDINVALPKQNTVEANKALVKLDSAIMKDINGVKKNLIALAYHISELDKLLHGSNDFVKIVENRYNIKRSQAFNYVRVGKYIEPIVNEKGLTIGYKGFTDKNGNEYGLSKMLAICEASGTNTREKLEAIASGETLDASMTKEKIKATLEGGTPKARKAETPKAEIPKAETPKAETPKVSAEEKHEALLKALRATAWIRVLTPDGQKYFIPVDVLKKYDTIAREELHIKPASEETETNETKTKTDSAK